MGICYVKCFEGLHIAPIMKNRTLLIIIFGKNNCENQSETSLQKKT
jgi:hypothetical protein